MTARHRIALTGGGTGGHIYPALSVYEQLKDDPDVEAILYIGARGHLEERLAQERQMQFVGLESAGLPRRLSPALLSWPFKMLGAVLEAGKVLQLFRPTVVLGTGGYAAAPPLFAALTSHVPFAVHEPDAHPGLVNRLFAPQSALCSLGMEGAKERLHSVSGKTIVNGNPIRSSFLQPPDRAHASAAIGIRSDLKTVLVTGGSQGAQAINEAVSQALPALLSMQPEIQIVHQVGENNLEQYKNGLPVEVLSNPRYQVRAYFDDLAIAYAACDIAVCRAGAMTISELGASGTAAIFIPYPFAAQDHQTHNARAIESKGAAKVIVQSELTAELVVETLTPLLQDDAKLQAMRGAMRALGRPNAAADLAKQIKELSAAAG